MYNVTMATDSESNISDCFHQSTKWEAHNLCWTNKTEEGERQADLRPKNMTSPCSEPRHRVSQCLLMQLSQTVFVFFLCERQFYNPS